jgi:hypothetical protein
MVCTPSSDFLQFLNHYTLYSLLSPAEEITICIEIGSIAFQVYMGNAIPFCDFLP